MCLKPYNKVIMVKKQVSCLLSLFYFILLYFFLSMVLLVCRWGRYIVLSLRTRTWCLKVLWTWRRWGIDIWQFIQKGDGIHLWWKELVDRNGFLNAGNNSFTSIILLQYFLNVFENLFWNMSTHLVDVIFKVQKAWHKKFSLDWKI